VVESHVKKRYWEIDYIRGIAVIMMVVFHLVFDLHYFDIVAINASTGFWRFFAYLTASLFLFIAGVALTLSGAHAQRLLSNKEFAYKYLRRGFFIFLLGMVLTLITWILVPDMAIFFGILHLIGVSVMLAPIFLRFFWANLLAAILLFSAAGISMVREGPMWLLWFGVHSPDFTSFDYTPVVPWLGLILLGIFSGKVLYPEGKRIFKVPEREFPTRREVDWLGRHSLVIYLIHQPLILLALIPFIPDAALFI